MQQKLINTRRSVSGVRNQRGTWGLRGSSVFSSEKVLILAGPALESELPAAAKDDWFQQILSHLIWLLLVNNNCYYKWTINGRWRKNSSDKIANKATQKPAESLRHLCQLCGCVFKDRRHASILIRKDTKPQLLCPFLQGEAERTSPGEAETGGEDHGPVQGSGPQHAPASQQGQVMFTHTCRPHSQTSWTQDATVRWGSWRRDITWRWCHHT